MRRKDEPSPGREPQRLLGFTVPPGGWRPGHPDNEPRVLGLPLSWFNDLQPRRPDLRWARHPLRWARWRLEVHRSGPYAPDYQERASRH